MIYLIRHGEPAGSWGNHPNPGLTELGQEQAEAAARSLAEAGAKRAVVSPLKRCRETAAPFEKRIETHARIETAVGEIITPPGVVDRTQWLKTAMSGRWADLGPEFDAWRAGVMAAIKTLPDETAVFTHFVAINVIVGLIAGDDRVVHFRPAHCSITRLQRIHGGLLVAELGLQAASVVT